MLYCQQRYCDNIKRTAQPYCPTALAETEYLSYVRNIDIITEIYLNEQKLIKTGIKSV